MGLEMVIMKNKEIEELLKNCKIWVKTDDIDYTRWFGLYELSLLLSYIEQLEECYCNRTDCIGRIKDSKKYDSLLQKYKQLENNRDKAIEILERHTRYSTEELLNILKGDSDE